MKSTKIFLFLLVFLFSSQVHAQVVIETVYLVIKAGEKPVRNFAVHNKSDKAILVKTEVFEVDYSSSEGEKLNASKNLIISPKRFSIPPLGRRVVRILLKNTKVDKQKAYRINFAPDARSDDKDKKENENEKKKNMQLKVMTGMGLLLFVDPPKPVKELKITRADKKVIIENIGTISALVGGLKLCKKTDESSCEAQKAFGKRLYPGNVLSIDVPDDKKLKFIKSYPDEEKAIDVVSE